MAHGPAAVGELRRTHGAVVLGRPVERAVDTELARLVAALERSRAAVAEGIERGVGRIEAGQARLLAMGRLLSSLARLELGEGRPRDGRRQLAKGVDRRRRSD